MFLGTNPREEIASHGLNWIEHRDFTVDEERAEIAEAVRMHTLVTGERPRGWYTGRCSENTLDLITEAGGFYAARISSLLRPLTAMMKGKPNFST